MRRVHAIPVFLAALVIATACGTPDDSGIPSAHSGSPTPSTSASNAGSSARWAQCMRAHGQNVPDPDPQGNVTIGPPPGGDSAAWEKAMRACQRYLPSQVRGHMDAQQLGRLRAYAACMRAHGIEMTDPDPRTGKSQIEGRLKHASKAQIRNDPQFKAADAACEGKLTDSKGKPTETPR